MKNFLKLRWEYGRDRSAFQWLVLYLGLDGLTKLPDHELFVKFNGVTFCFFFHAFLFRNILYLVDFILIFY